MRKHLIFALLVVLVLSGVAYWLLNQPARAPVPVDVPPTITPVRIVITPTAPPTLTPTARPTTPPEPSPTPSLPPPTATPTPEPSPVALPFQPQLGSGVMIPAFPYTDLGCRWVGIAGQVLDPSGAGLTNITVLLMGQVDQQPVDQVAVTLSESPYGPGGYEFFLSDHLPATGQGLLVQLFDPGGQALSEPVPFHLPASCERNLLLMNFLAAPSADPSALAALGN